MKKILITYASYGNGHKKVAEYIEKYITSKKYEIKMINILDYTGKVCNFSVKMHNYIYSHHLEQLFSMMYEGTNNKIFTSIYKEILKKIIFNKKLKNEYIEFKPDLVISSHFYGSNIANLLIKEKLINSKVMTIVTDYKAHNFWMADKNEEEIFIVANEIVKKEMIQKKCYSKRIYPYGLPFDLFQFNEELNKEEIYLKYDLDKNKKIILFFAGGGNGTTTYLKYFNELLKLKLNQTEILFVSGNSKEAMKEATILKNKYNADNVHIFGYVNKIYELLYVSDFVITKPGGVTITECIETKKVMLLLPGMGGQEKYNSKFVCKNNYGTKVRFLFKFRNKIKEFVSNNSNEFEKYKNSYKNVNRNKSLKKIRKLIKNLK